MKLIKKKFKKRERERKRERENILHSLSLTTGVFLDKGENKPSTIKELRAWIYTEIKQFLQENNTIMASEPPRSDFCS